MIDQMRRRWRLRRAATTIRPTLTMCTLQHPTPPPRPLTMTSTRKISDIQPSSAIFNVAKWSFFCAGIIGKNMFLYIFSSHVIYNNIYKQIVTFGFALGHVEYNCLKLIINWTKNDINENEKSSLNQST